MHVGAFQDEPQETSSCFTQQYRSRKKYLIGRWSKIARSSCAQFVGHGDRCVGASSWEKKTMRNNKPQKTNSLMADKRVADNIDFVPTNAHISSPWASLFVFEDNDAVIKMIMNGPSPTLRHVSRTHRVNLDWLFDSISLAWNPDRTCCHLKANR